MVSDIEQDPEPEWLRNLPVCSEEIGFSRDQLLECDACGKLNAPNRVACLYCGAAMDSFAPAKVEIEIPESWEKGHNVILLETRGGDIERAAAKLGEMIALEKQEANTVLEAGRKIPVARVKTESQAAHVANELADFGIKTLIVSDEDLQAASPPTRLRSLMFSGTSIRLELFNRGRFDMLPRDEFAYIIPGVLLEGTIKSIERRKRRSTRTLSEAEMTSDEPLIDIYSKSDPTGWRVRASGFDFSCLGSEKSMIVGDNMKKLIAKLAEFAPGVRIVNDYMNLRSLLEYSWPTESRRDALALGLRRKQTSKVLTTNNGLQLTKFSRLQWQLNEKKV